LNNLPVIHTIK